MIKCQTFPVILITTRCATDVKLLLFTILYQCLTFIYNTGNWQVTSADNCLGCFYFSHTWSSYFSVSVLKVCTHDLSPCIIYGCYRLATSLMWHELKSCQFRNQILKFLTRFPKGKVWLLDWDMLRGIWV